jgi:hypothetical protein
MSDVVTLPQAQSQQQRSVLTQHCVAVSLYRFWWLSVTTSPPRLDRLRTAARFCFYALDAQLDSARRNAAGSTTFLVDHPRRRLPCSHRL